MKSLTELKITYKRKRNNDHLLKEKVANHRMVYDLFRHLKDEIREQLICLHLNPSREIISYEQIALGTRNQVLADVAEIYRGAVITGADSIILLHNHPLASCNPSNADLKAFHELSKAGEILRMSVADFIIIGENGYYSLSLNEGFTI